MAPPQRGQAQQVEAVESVEPESIAEAGRQRIGPAQPSWTGLPPGPSRRRKVMKPWLGS